MKMLTNPDSLKAWREYAKAALNGCLSYSHYNEAWGDFHNNGTPESVADNAAKYADAMLEQELKRIA
ncbi:hypothetical protein ELG77_08790 [Rhizobium leguminosarum]|uniref:hypothetical protein n=1 Tax=Rhizobium leguminosarum TaxID=384 RepID=UPI00102F51CE|nr:hypothetical protein [Rhizobium leguminosarum]TBG41859.1 hypothetical protein ELG77_08790 [Rhizobium leguminosarum]